MMITLAIAVLFLLLLSGLPIAFSLALSGLMVLFMMNGPAIGMAIPQIIFVSLDNFILVAVPLFILAADILVQGNVTKFLIRLVEVMVRHWKGGLAIAAVLSCALFAAISGSSTATAVAIGSILIPEMVSRGYDKKVTMGLIAVAGGLGILIPPSIPLILYGTIAEESIGKLFMAGVIPGLILTLGLVLVARHTFKNVSNDMKRASWSERKEALKKASWGLGLPLIILGGIYGGFFTPTEAAGVSVIYAYLVSVLVYKGFKPKDTVQILANSSAQMSMIMLIIAGATIFAYVLTFEQIPQTVVNFVLSQELNTLTFILAVNLILLILGMFLEVTSILLITLPIFLPLLMQFGINPIHFAIIFVMNMELALITPPIGMNLFVVSSIGNLGVDKVFQGTVRFMLVMFVSLILTIFFPSLSLILTE
jgi:C4-dicarboxylate transporter DctM subunit